MVRYAMRSCWSNVSWAILRMCCDLSSTKSDMRDLPIWICTISTSICWICGSPPLPPLAHLMVVCPNSLETLNFLCPVLDPNLESCFRPCENRQIRNWTLHLEGKGLKVAKVCFGLSNLTFCELICTRTFGAWVDVAMYRHCYREPGNTRCDTLETCWA